MDPNNKVMQCKIKKKITCKILVVFRMRGSRKVLVVPMHSGQDEKVIKHEASLPSLPKAGVLLVTGLHG